MTEKKSHGRTKAGVELAGAVLDRMAEEAEAGLDVATLPPPRSTGDGVRSGRHAPRTPRPRVTAGTRRSRRE